MGQYKRKRPRVWTEEAIDKFSDVDAARAAHAATIAARWLKDGATLFDGRVTVEDVVNDHGNVDAELVRLACIRVIKREPGLARMRAVGVTVAGIGVVAEWVAQGATVEERERRKLLVTDSFVGELDKIARAEYAKRMHNILTEDNDA